MPRKLKPVHPGEILHEEFMVPLGLSMNKVAMALRVPVTRIADIIVAVDEPIKATRCRADSAKGCLGRTGRCLTHDLWEELGRQIEVFLESVTLADVLERRVLGRARAAGAADSSHAAAD